MNYRLTKEEPIEKESIKARLMANQVLDMLGSVGKRHWSNASL